MSTTPVRSSFTELEVTDRCILCHAVALHALPGQRQLSRCRTCGHIQLNPRPTQAAIGASYDLADADAVHAVWESEREGRRRMWEKRVARIVGMVPTAGRAFDVGAGFGDFLVLLKERGWEVAGTEFSEEARDAARTRGIELEVGQLEELEIPDGAYDLITLWHVLEHLPDPGTALDGLVRALAPGGSLAIAVPNDSLFPRMVGVLVTDTVKRIRRRPATGVRELWGERRVGQEIHLSFFSPVRLAKALEARGLEVVENGLDDHFAVPSKATDRKFRVYQRVARLTRLNLHQTMLVVGRKPRG